MWIYQQFEPGMWTVGFYDPKGKFIFQSHYFEEEKAIDMVNTLNGGDCMKTRLERKINANDHVQGQ
jgi:hypothetical protein